MSAMLSTYNPYKSFCNKNTQQYNSTVSISTFTCRLLTFSMEEERTNAGKYLSESLDNDDHNFEFLLNQWKLLNNKIIFKFVLWSLR